MTNTRTISCPDDVDRVFKELLKKKPSDISFSRMLAICAQEYIKLMGNAKISEFTNEKDMFAAFWDKISPTEHVDSCARRYNLIKMVK